MWYKHSQDLLRRYWPTKLPLERRDLAWLLLLAWETGGLREDYDYLGWLSGLPKDQIPQIWQEFTRVAECRDGHWMLPEQWIGIKEYQAKQEAGRIGGQASAQARAQAVVKQSSTSASTDLDKRREEAAPASQPDVLEKQGHLGEVFSKKQKKLHMSSEQKTSSQSDDVKAIFTYWQVKMRHTQAKLTSDRRRKILNRLAEGYTVSQIQQGIDGCLLSDFHQGQNQQGKVFDDIELICRDGSHLEQFINHAVLEEEITSGRRERPRQETVSERNFRESQALTDPEWWRKHFRSGGSGGQGEGGGGGAA